MRHRKILVVCPRCSAKLADRRIVSGTALWSGRDTDLYTSGDSPSRSLGVATCPECGATNAAEEFDESNEDPGLEQRPALRPATASAILDGIDDGSLLRGDTIEREHFVRRLAFWRRNHPPAREEPEVDDPRWRANAEALIVVLEGYPEGARSRQLRLGAERMKSQGRSREIIGEKADAQALLEAIEHDLLRAELLRHLGRFDEAVSALDHATETALAVQTLTGAKPHTKSVATELVGEAIAAVISTQRRLIEIRDTNVHPVVQ